MVSKMKPLLKLWLLKIKGTIRNLFKRKASGVFVIIMILFYGAMIVSLFNVDAGQIMAVNNIDLHMGIINWFSSNYAICNIDAVKKSFIYR